MSHCTSCGASVSDTAAFCTNCGQPQPRSAAVAAPARSGLSENTAALLSYVLGWITGLIFLLIDKRPYVRFHAAQSLVTFGALNLARIVLGMIFGVGWWFGGGARWGRLTLGLPLLGAIGLLAFVLWIYCMVRAYQGARFKLPIAGDLAEALVKQ